MGIKLSQSFNLKMICLVGIFLFGFLLRLDGLRSRGYEYDEVWTYQHYVNIPVKDIFSELSTPNNHPLNSFFMKYSTAVFGVTPLGMRFPAFFAGVLLMFIIPLTVYIAFRDLDVSVFSGAMVAFNGALIHYSQTARGYSMQTLLVSLFILHALRLSGRRGGRWDCYFLWLFPVLSILTLSTSILYVFPVSLIHFLFIVRRNWSSDGGWREKVVGMLRVDIGVFVSYFILGGFVLFWYIHNYAAFRAGQYFGSSLDTLGTFALFIKDTLSRLSNPCFWVLCFPVVFYRRWRFLFGVFLFSILFPFVLAFFTQAGPPRVYIPILIYLFIVAGKSCSLILRHFVKGAFPRDIVLVVISILFFVEGKREMRIWTPFDWGVVYPKIEDAFPQRFFICYPPAAGLSIFANHLGRSIVGNIQRIPLGGDCCFVVAGNWPGGVCVPKSRAISVRNIAGTPCRIYNLKRIYPSSLEGARGSLPKERMLFAFIRPNSYGRTVELKQYLADALPGAWMCCNPWFARSVYTESQRKVIALALICDIGSNVECDTVASLMEELRGEVFFYAIE